MVLRRRSAFRVLLDALRREGRHPTRRRLAAAPRLLRAAASGAYTAWDRRRAAAVLLGLVYVVSPVDVVPELVLGLLGLTDDTLVLAWVAGALLDEVDSYLDWEARRGRVVRGDVVA